jgi:hypothetical protein
MIPQLPLNVVAPELFVVNIQDSCQRDPRSFSGGITRNLSGAYPRGGIRRP